MKVKKLVEQLGKFDPEAEVKLNGYNGLSAIFVLARADDPMQVWLESEEDCDMKHQLEEFFSQSVENGSDELDAYSELLDLGITVDTVRRFVGSEQADHMQQFCEEHGLLTKTTSTKEENKMNENAVRGYKAFHNDWTCRDKQYSCPGKFEEEVDPSVCEIGMHFCKKLADCFDYYNFNAETKVAEVIAYGKIVEEGIKCSTNKLEIVREISWSEVLEIVNTGKQNSGNRNSGNRNSGNRNSGNWNSGNRNSGNWNSGNWNSGNWNSGNCNSGDWNSGYCNSGNWNSGNWNSGDWNKCNHSSGCFNTKKNKIYLFNKPSEWSYRDWFNSEASRLMNQIPCNILEYIYFEDMTDEEKKEHPEAETTGGYLKILDNSENAIIWWRGLSATKKEIITSIPNFDREIFKEITGIDVDK